MEAAAKVGAAAVTAALAASSGFKYHYAAPGDFKSAILAMFENCAT